MKNIVFIGNRMHALSVLLASPEKYNLEEIFVLKDSFLQQELAEKHIPFRLFSGDAESRRLITEWLMKHNFDILISNGCPFILPVDLLSGRHEKALFINVHPTYLPHLKGKTPLNGVILLGYEEIGATVHYMQAAVDTGNIIFQKKIHLTPDLDQGLIYFLSFLLEGEVMQEALHILENSQFTFKGHAPAGNGSSFNRKDSLFTVDFAVDTDADIIRKISSVGITSQGVLLHFENKTYRVFEAEKIINPFLLKQFEKSEPGDLLLVYSNKVLIRTREGIVKFSYAA
jgi:methionyl-tRNA formyltransferase